jgi:hypothetical protein
MKMIHEMIQDRIQDDDTRTYKMRSQIVMTSADGKVLRSQIASIKTEGEVLSSQNASIDMRGRHVKYMPYAFTESGIAMLSSVLRSSHR